MDVPAKAAILLVPNKTGNGIFGNVIKRNGVWIKPPPPTTASINPAVNAESANNMIVAIPYSLYKLVISMFAKIIAINKKARLFYQTGFVIILFFRNQIYLYGLQCLLFLLKHQTFHNLLFRHSFSQFLVVYL